MCFLAADTPTPQHGTCVWTRLHQTPRPGRDNRGSKKPEVPEDVRCSCCVRRIRNASGGNKRSGMCGTAGHAHPPSALTPSASDALASLGAVSQTGSVKMIFQKLPQFEAMPSVS